jgi:hypothetical protein
VIGRRRLRTVGHVREVVHSGEAVEGGLTRTDAVRELPPGSPRHVVPGHQGQGRHRVLRPEAQGPSERAEPVRIGGRLDDDVQGRECAQQPVQGRRVRPGRLSEPRDRLLAVREVVGDPEPDRGVDHLGEAEPEDHLE